MGVDILSIDGFECVSLFYLLKFDDDDIHRCWVPWRGRYWWPCSGAPGHIPPPPQFVTIRSLQEPRKNSKYHTLHLAVLQMAVDWLLPWHSVLL